MVLFRPFVKARTYFEPAADGDVNKIAQKQRGNTVQHIRNGVRSRKKYARKNSADRENKQYCGNGCNRRRWLFKFFQYRFKNFHSSAEALRFLIVYKFYGLIIAFL